VKLVLAVIQNEDESALIQAMETQGLGITRIGSSGGFLRANNVTLMMAIKDDQLERVLGLLNKHCKRRTRRLRPRAPSMEARGRFPDAVPIEIGGATVFIVGLEQMERID
jgi:uncharacterized protein YaaQ